MCMCGLVCKAASGVVACTNRYALLASRPSWPPHLAGGKGRGGSQSSTGLDPKPTHIPNVRGGKLRSEAMFYLDKVWAVGQHANKREGRIITRQDLRKSKERTRHKEQGVRKQSCGSNGSRQETVVHV